MTDAAIAPPGTRAGSDPVRSALDRILDTDPAAADRDALASIGASVARVRSWLDAYEIGCARRAEALARAGRCESTESMFARSGQRCGKDAAKVTDRSSVCESFESFESFVARRSNLCRTPRRHGGSDARSRRLLRSLSG